MRKTEFANEEFYHIYNRGVDKREVFLDKLDYERFLKSIKEFNCIDPIGSLYEKSFKNVKLGSESPIGLSEPKLVEIICFCFNPNHYHLMLKQLQERGVEKFMHKIGMGYTNYFNKKYDRSGALFQGRYKAIHIDSNEYLLYLSAYINKNNFIHGYNNIDWKYSSLAEYKKENKQKASFCNTEPILGQFRDRLDYDDFINKNALYLKDKKEDGYLLEK